MTESWHAPDDLLDRFAADPGAESGPTIASLEAHLVVCERCRRALNARVDASDLDRSWSAIAEQIDQPRSSPLERILGVLGVPDATARMVGATPALSAASLVAVVVVAAGAVLASFVTDSAAAFLVLAPLLPLVTVAAVFAPATDPAGEFGVATPMHGIGLVLRRSAVVLSAAFMVLAIADLAIGDLGAPVVAWLLPAWALAAGAIALSISYRAEVSVAGLGLGWMAAVAVARWTEGPGAGYAESAVFDRRGQVVALAILVLALGLVFVRRDRFQTLKVYQ